MRVSFAITVMLAAVIGITSCSRTPAPPKPTVHRTRAFEDIFGELPAMPAPGPCYAMVAYFPSARQPGTFLPAPLFSFEQGKEEKLAVRTVIRGIDAEEFGREIVRPFPPGADLQDFRYLKGKATVVVGGTFRAAAMPPDERRRAAGSLALTVAQFGKASAVDVTDPEGNVHFGAGAEEAETADPGDPKTLGFFAIREAEGRAPSALTVLFDRPVIVDSIAFFPSGGKTPYPGEAYSTAYGMTVEFRPEPKIDFDPGSRYRVRFVVHDGKGRRAAGEWERAPKDVVRQ